MNAVTRAELAQVEAPTVTFKIDGREVTAPANRTIIEIADEMGVAIPRLCYKPGLDKVGNCRSCMVEIKGERVLAASCCRHPTDGMEISTTSERRTLHSGGSSRSRSRTRPRRRPTSTSRRIPTTNTCSSSRVA